MYEVHCFHGKVYIMHLNLRRVDLNLLLVFDSLYRNRSVSIAAEELAMSPSACSHALSRLRLALSDELFVRYGSAMQPTVQAEQLAEAVRAALTSLSVGLSALAPFNPSTSNQTFTFTASDVTALAVLPDLIAQLEYLAPNLNLKINRANHRDSLDDLSTGRAQFVLGFSDEYSGSYDGVEVLDGVMDDYVVVANSAYARNSSNLSLEQYLSARHIAVLPWSDGGSVIDTALAKMNLKRNVAVQLPSMTAAPFIVAKSQLLLTLPRHTAMQLCHDQRFTSYEIPFPSPRFSFKVLFHARYASSPGHSWIREQLGLILLKGSTGNICTGS